jgi:RsiW-degrading membrane proteinase PrsW (M82 family)
MATRPPRAGGAHLALSIFAGAGLGIAFGQPSIGLLAGTGVGLLILAAIWLIDRR